MPDFLIPVIFGWPSMIASLGFALAGVLFKMPVLSYIGAALLAAPAWYLGHYSIVAWSLPLFEIGSGIAVRKSKLLVAWLLLLPVFLAILRLAYLVLTQ
ncbi:MAG: hypothetical protein IT313_10905 [Anaerolineales bacterium]|nr:hypothetical protein [Anaerolineales bacterium]